MTPTGHEGACGRLCYESGVHRVQHVLETEAIGRRRSAHFPQTRVTDHRIGLTVHRLAEVLDGDLDQLIEPIFTAEVAESLAD